VPGPGPFSAAYLDHLASPRGQGALEGATHRATVEDPVCGDRLTLDLRVEAGVVREARFRVAGCTGAIAVGSALASLLPGRNATETAVSGIELEATLEGVPPARRHALRLATETLRAAIRAPRAPEA